MKLLQETRGYAEITNRRPPGRNPGLGLLQMRSNFLRATGLKEKRTLQIDVQALPEAPVKIRHLTTFQAPR